MKKIVTIGCMMITGTIAVKAADEMAFVENEHICVGVNLK